jgi:hypothetical protein
MNPGERTEYVEMECCSATSSFLGVIRSIQDHFDGSSTPSGGFTTSLFIIEEPLIAPAENGMSSSGAEARFHRAVDGLAGWDLVVFCPNFHARLPVFSTLFLPDKFGAEPVFNIEVTKFGSRLIFETVR